jgi:predicted ATP-dependent protease
MSDSGKARELGVEELGMPIDVGGFAFTTTEELSELDEIVGQPRAQRAFELGLGIRDSGYNIYAAGLTGTGKESLARRMLSRKAVEEQTPADWVYVNNFDQEDRPLAISLPPGKGVRLRDQMEKLVDRLADEVPKAFRREDFSRERRRLQQRYEQEGRERFVELQKAAEERGLVIQQGPGGTVMMLPRREDGKPMESEEFEKLPAEKKEQIGKRQQEMAEQVSATVAHQREMERRLHVDVREVERGFAARIIDPAIGEVAGGYESTKLHKWFGELRGHMLDNLNQFQDEGEGRGQQLAALLGGGGAPPKDKEFTHYKVNVVIDNSDIDGAPVIFEGSPNYKNLFGTIPGVADRMGRVTTNFTQIRAGSLLRANGGYLVFDLLEALVEPLVWKELKRTIKSGIQEYHMYDPYGVFATSALKPEPIPLHVKLVVTGSQLVYYLLQLYDGDFAEIFKVKADFAPELERENATNEELGRFVSRLQKESNVLPFGAEGVAELVRAGARLAGDKEKITAELGRLADLARESSYWAKSEGSGRVEGAHVRRAMDEKVFRSNLVAVQLRELIAKGSILISVDRKATGQINGLSVAHLGDYMFGRPSRITASIGIGTAGLVNIERESRLSGRTFDKAMLILDGYLRNKYATHHPLALSASLAMEQSYGMIEGDSASVAELTCLLSALARVPLRQDIALTGSVNQWGQVQAVGGVSEKVEGFYDVCRELGVTGNQGVCLPSSNIRNLVLRGDVIRAVEEGRFHVWAIDSVDQALELLSGITAGDIDRESSFHWRVDRRLQDMLHILKEQKVVEPGREVHMTELVHDGRPDPRPPLPGRDS